MWNYIVKVLYGIKNYAVAISLMLIVYINVYLWFFLPFLDFSMNWQPDSKLHVYGNFDENAASAELLKIGDIVVAIDDKPTNRTSQIYSVPIKDEYTFTVQRGDSLIELDIRTLDAPGSVAMSVRLPSGILSFITWLVGVIILYFAYKENDQATVVGYQFLLMGVFSIGVQGALLNVPGAWVLGVPVMGIVGVGWTYLGFLPRTNALNSKINNVMTVLISAAVLFFFISLFEGLVLFTQGNSIEELIGVSTYDVGLIWLAIGLLSTFVILIFRSILIPRSYIKQQILILIFFIGLGVLPAVTMTFLPNSLLGITIIPFPISLSLLSLVPAGYFYVIYRRGYLGLDNIMGTALPMIVLAIMMLTLYGLGLYIFELGSLWDVGVESGLGVTAMLILLPAIILALSFADKLGEMISTFLFGVEATRTETIPQFANAISLSPEVETIQNIITSIAQGFNISKATLILENETGYLLPVATYQTDEWHPLHKREIKQFAQPIIKSAVNMDHTLFERLSWSEILIPVIVRNEQTGLLAMSRPFDGTGYFNAKQVSFLTQVTNIIAVGSAAIQLYESSRTLVRKLARARQVERRKIAAQIHDRPLQELSNATGRLINIARKLDEREVILVQTTKLDRVQDELREIMTSLFPSALELGLVAAVREVVREFRETSVFDIEIRLEEQIAKTAYTMDISATIHQVLVESLNNVKKHARAENVCVQLFQEHEFICLAVEDDGIGSNIRSDFSNDTEFLRRRHFGIVLMMEAAGQVGGTLRMQSGQNGEGTRVELKIPVY